jgi:hypothetical protein
MKFLNFSTLVGHFCFPGSGYGSTEGMIESGSNPDSDQKHCKKNPVHVARKHMPGHAKKYHVCTRGLITFNFYNIPAARA